MGKEMGKVFKSSNKKKVLAWILSIIGGISIATLFVALFTGFFQRLSIENANIRNNVVVMQNGKYVGDTSWGWLEGEGSFDFATGETYTGSWNLSEIEGAGTIQYPSIGSYIGEFINSQKHGKGTFIWNNGEKYEGEFAFDQIQGNGKYCFADGSFFEGSFVSNRIANGKFCYSDSTREYIIQYVNGSMSTMKANYANGVVYSGGINTNGLSGNGTMTFPNGDVFSGNFEKGSRKGTGKYVWENGDVYLGEWKDDQMNGQGKYTFASARSLDGTFLNNEFVSGYYIISNNSIICKYEVIDKTIRSLDAKTLSDNTSFSVQYSEGKPIGDYTITYSNGDNYVGALVNYRKEGTGTYTWKDGSKYIGDWENDAMNGNGEFFYSPSSKGYKLVGVFQNNQPTSICRYYLSSSDSYYYETTWENGKCIHITEYAR